MSTYRTDCRHFRGDRPCAPHKLHGAECATCTSYYDPVQRRLLLVKLAAMGDVLRTTSLLPAIHRRWPASHLTWVTAPDSVPLLEGNPHIDRVVAYRGAVPLEVLAERYDVVINPDAAPDSCALAQLARTGQRVGFAFDERGAPVPLGDGARHWMAMGVSDALKRDNRRTYQELMADVLEVDYRREPPQLEISDDERARGREFRLRCGGGDRLIVGLNTGAGGRWKYKRWTEDGYLQLVQRLGAAGHKVLLLGGPGEAQRNARLVAASGGAAIDTGGDNPVRRFAGIVEVCDVVVTGDTLAMHIAIAARVPTVVLFGPTSLHEIDVFDLGERIAPDLDCLVCYKTDCDFVPNCMASIGVDAVYDAVLRCGRVTAST